MTAPAQLIEGRRVAAMIAKARREARAEALEEAAICIERLSYLLEWRSTQKATVEMCAEHIRTRAARPEETR